MNFSKKQPARLIKSKNILIVACIVFQAIGTQSIFASEPVNNVELPLDDILAQEPPQQGTMIPCERCVILYPENYEGEEAKFCPLCHGAKEHFQPARMMTDDLALSVLQELDQRIIQLQKDMIMGSFDATVTVDQLKELRALYKQKLFHLLIYGPKTYGPTRDALRELEVTIEFREKI